LLSSFDPLMARSMHCHCFGGQSLAVYVGPARAFWLRLVPADRLRRLPPHLSISGFSTSSDPTSWQCLAVLKPWYHIQDAESARAFLPADLLPVPVFPAGPYQKRRQIPGAGPRVLYRTNAILCTPMQCCADYPHKCVTSAVLGVQASAQPFLVFGLLTTGLAVGHHFGGVGI